MTLQARAILLASYLFLVAAATLAVRPAVAATPVLDLPGPVPTERVFDGHVGFLRDPVGARDVAGVAARPDEFSPVAGRSADFGYTTDALWLRLAVRNTSADVSDWRLHLRENFMPTLDFHLVDSAGTVHPVERHGPDTIFADRRIAYPEIVLPFVLPPGESAVLLIRYTSGGSSELSFRVETADSFARIAARKTAKNYIYYGMMIFLVLAALASWATTRRPIFGAYGCYATFGLLFVMHADGNAFQYLWPGLPGFNAYASVLLGAGLIVCGANFARMFLQTRVHHPVLDVALLAVMAIAAGFVAATAVADTQAIKKILVLLALVSVLLFTVSGLVAARRRFREVRFYVIAWVGALVSSGIMTARHWFGIEISEELQFDSMRIVLVADATLMGFAIVDRFNQFKRSHQRALERSLTEARRNLDLSRRLTDLEQKYALVLSVADRGEKRLAEAVHDIRQPLQALRLNVRRLLDSDGGGGGGGGGAGRPMAGGEAADFEKTLEYLETLVGGELARISLSAGQGPDDTPDEGPGEGPDDGAVAETYEVREVLASVHEMFAAAAAEKGLALTTVPCSARTDLPPLVLMRVACNLVSNAIKYTPSGRILMGARREGGHLRLEVHDTGPGLSAGDFARAQDRAERLDGADHAEGSGLGLAILRHLAQRHGLDVALCPGRRTGTGISVRFAAIAGDAGRLG